MTNAQQHLFCFGLGDSARRTARLLSGLGWTAGGTVRGADKAARLAREGVDAQVFDGTGDITPPPGAHWLISIPPGEEGCPAFAAAGARARTAASITYLSTTGVYGDLAGGWAFAWSPVAPGTRRGRARVAAERQWSSAGVPVRLVRLPGIYGPGRSALDRVRDGTARRIVKPGHVFSRIHVGDIASGLAALMARPDQAGVFHLCDDLPAPPQDVIAHACTLLGEPIPPDIPFDAAELSEMARSFYSECKRVSNARIKARLGWRPAEVERRGFGGGGFGCFP